MTQQPTQHQTAPNRRTPSSSVAGVMDTIADGVTLVTRRPQLMIVPFLVNLGIWLSPRISMKPVIDGMLSVLETYNRPDTEQLVDEVRKVADKIYVTDALGIFMPSLFTGLSLDSVMGLLLSFLAPSGALGMTRDNLGESFRFGLGGTHSLSAAGSVIAIGLVCVFVASFLLALFRVPIARAVRGSTKLPLAQEIVESWRRFVMYLLALAAIAVAASIPFSIIVGIASLFGSGALVLIAFGMLMFGTMIGVYSWFTVDAMLLHHIRPRRALNASWDVGRQYFGQISIFTFVYLLVLVASFKLWGELSRTLPGLLVALVGNAFLSASLAASSMYFYGDRFRKLREVRSSRKRIRPTVTR